MDIKVLEGLTLTEIDQQGDDVILFTSECGRKFQMLHHQDCCESVTIDDVNGDYDDLIGSPILVAEERTDEGDDGSYDYYTWTFYTFRTLKGSVDLKWYGTSNGYYSESVDFEEITQ